MIILGIDPGTATTGWGVIEYNKGKKPEYHLIAYGCIKTFAKTPFADRLLIIENQIDQLVSEYKPDKAAIEEIFFAKNTKTAFAVGHARGVVLLSLAKANIPFIELTPLQVKQGITGFGRAVKSQIGYMVKQLLKLKEIPKPDDAADAIAAAIVASNIKN